MTEPRVISRFGDYDGFHQAMRARADELQITRETLDAEANLTSGHASKILAPYPIKALGRQTMGKFLRGLRVELWMVEVPELMAGNLLVKRKRATPQLEPSKHGLGNLPEARTIARKALHDVLRANGKKGGAKGGHARAAALTPNQRRRIAKKGAKARWHTPKLTEIKAS